jgi:hypothetical protein
MSVPASNERVSADGPRRTPIGAFNVARPGTASRREIPVPWIDCTVCSWRHYPSTDLGLWHIATTCVSCGADLETPKAPA